MLPQELPLYARPATDNGYCTRDREELSNSPREDRARHGGARDRGDKTPVRPLTDERVTRERHCTQADEGVGNLSGGVSLLQLVDLRGLQGEIGDRVLITFLLYICSRARRPMNSSALIADGEAM